MKTADVRNRAAAAAVAFITACMPVQVVAGLVLGPGEPVQAGGIAIDVPGYSVPSFVFWDGDTLGDLVIGEGGGGVVEAKVRVYLNAGSAESPLFAGFFYVQSNGSDLVGAGSG